MIEGLLDSNALKQRHISSLEDFKIRARPGSRKHQATKDYALLTWHKASIKGLTRSLEMNNSQTLNFREEQARLLLAANYSVTKLEARINKSRRDHIYNRAYTFVDSTVQGIIGEKDPDLKTAKIDFRDYIFDTIA